MPETGRPRGPRPWSAIVVAVVGLAIIAFGLGGRLASGPSASSATVNPTTSSNSAPVASVVPVRTAGPLPPIEATEEVVYDGSHSPEPFEGTLVQPMGTLDTGIYTFTIVCSGPADLTIVPTDGSAVDPPLTSACDGTVVRRDLEVTEPELDLEANASASTAWHVVISRPTVAEATPPEMPIPTIAPLVSAVPCGPSDALAAPPAASIVTGGHRYPGTASMTSWNGTGSEARVDGGVLPAVTIDATSAAEIRTADDACAATWTIEAQSMGLVDPAPGPLIVLASHGSGSSAALPFGLSRFPIDGLGPGQWLLRATLGFDRGREVVIWRVILDAFLFPRATLTAADHLARGLDIGCPSWEVAGDGGSDQCGPIPWPIDQARALRVVGDDPVTLAIPGWGSLASARFTAVSAARSKAKTGEAPARTMPISIENGQLILPYGDLAVLVEVHASRPDAAFETAYLFRVVHVRP